MPTADVILVRDVFTHLADEEVLTALRSIKRVRPTLLIASTFRGCTADRSQMARAASYASIDLEADWFGLGRANWFVSEPPATVAPEDVRGMGIWCSEDGSPLSRTLDALVRRMPIRIDPGQVRSEGAVDRAGPKSVCVDGRGFAFIVPDLLPATELSSSSVRIAPAYVPVGSVERRLTKRRDLGGGRMVLGHTCVAAVEDANGHATINAGDLCLVPPSFEGDSEIVGPGVSGIDGYLRCSVETEIARIIPLPALDRPHLWLLAAPLSIVLSADDLISELGEEPNERRAYLWGAGTMGMLFAWYLLRHGWEVSLSDVHPIDSHWARSVEGLGVTYTGPDFDWAPTPAAPLGIDTTTEDTPGRNRHASVSRVLISVAEMDRQCRHRTEHRAGTPRSVGVPAVSHAHLLEAIRLLAASPDGPWDDLVAGIHPLASYEAAIFPAVPGRLRIIALQAET